VTVARNQTMSPATTESLDRFLKTVEQSGRYLLASAHLISETKLRRSGDGLGHTQGQLIVRNARFSMTVVANDTGIVALGFGTAMNRFSQV